MSPASFNQIPLDGVDAVLLDLDNTLYAYEPAHQAALRTTYNLCAPYIETFELFEKDYRAARNHVTARLSPQGACRSRLLAFQRLVEEWGLKQAYSMALSLDEKYWSAFIQAMRLSPEAKKFLETLSAHNIRTCLVTDMTAAVQIRKTQALDIAHHITYMVTSEETGAEKPDPRMFQAALDKLGISKKHAVMIGDDFKKDVEGARAFGIASFHVTAGELP